MDEIQDGEEVGKGCLGGILKCKGAKVLHPWQPGKCVTDTRLGTLVRVRCAHHSIVEEPMVRRTVRLRLRTVASLHPR